MDLWLQCILSVARERVFSGRGIRTAFRLQGHRRRRRRQSNPQRDWRWARRNEGPVDPIRRACLTRVNDSKQGETGCTYQ